MTPSSFESLDDRSRENVPAAAERAGCDHLVIPTACFLSPVMDLIKMSA